MTDTLREPTLQERNAQLLAVVRMGIDMRRAQRLYFRATPGTKEKSDALTASLTRERIFDSAAAKVTDPAFDLVEGEGNAQPSRR